MRRKSEIFKVKFSVTIQISDRNRHLKGGRFRLEKITKGDEGVLKMRLLRPLHV